MTPATLIDVVIGPTFELLGSKYGGAHAETMLVAIALQESGLRNREQVGGPARGWWQFEVGGVKGVLHHPQSSAKAAEVCKALHYPVDSVLVQRALSHNDILACALARLLLWTDTKPLPTNESDGWAYYQRNWRPGRPRIERWGDSWAQAVATVYEH
jgi:hypothetical protein